MSPHRLTITAIKSLSQRREAPCEGTNSARLIIPGYGKHSGVQSCPPFCLCHGRFSTLCACASTNSVRSNCFSFWRDVFCCFTAIVCFEISLKSLQKYKSFFFSTLLEISLQFHELVAVQPWNKVCIIIVLMFWFCILIVVVPVWVSVNISVVKFHAMLALCCRFYSYLRNV
jgi:hypothetical protein